ncbi:MAG: tRNA (N6-isopentenyl adenosine(37)-C2)-methylthiotransferase MiaB [Candidatus Moraniibacteriota bacterium]
MKYYIKTFGCQMNESDSERIAGFLESQKNKPAKDIEKADIVIFNTCGIRQMAEDRAYGQIHNIRKQESGNKNQKSRKIVILTGCLANRKDVQVRLKNKVDLFCETKAFEEKFTSVIANAVKQSQNIGHNLSKYEIATVAALPHNDNYLNIIPKYSNQHIAYVPIMTGCNNFCSYCVVPYARGREVSRSSKEIILEIKNLLKNGCKEIILLGQNVNSYIDGKNTFPKLLQLIEKIPGHFWISFMSSHPKDFSDELIETIAKSKKICEHIHLPLQAGDNEILLAMNRKYTAEKYLNLVKKIKSAFAKYKPNKLYSITTDIIVGFPGETKKQFLESARVMKKVCYDLVYFGQFSPRPGTVAYKMKDNVSKDEKKKREFFLNEILKETAFENNQKYTGKTLEVLIDKKDGANYFGQTHSLKNVKIISTKKNLVGKFVKVKITKANIWNLEASLYIKP